MPLHSLQESINTLSALLKQARRLRSQQDSPAGAAERLDLLADETIDSMRTLVTVLLDAHARGDLEAMVKKDADDPHGGNPDRTAGSPPKQ
jgi:hypothetical protein